MNKIDVVVAGHICVDIIPGKSEMMCLERLFREY